MPSVLLIRYPFHGANWISWQTPKLQSKENTLKLMVVMFTVVSRGAPPLPQHTHHPGWHQAWSARGPRDFRQTKGQETDTHILPTGEFAFLDI